MTRAGAFRNVVEMKLERKSLGVSSRLGGAFRGLVRVTDQRRTRVLMLVGLLVIAAIFAFGSLAVSPSGFTPVITGSPLLPLIVGIFSG